MLLSYTAKGDKMPFFVKRLTNNWKIKPLSANSCRVFMRLECDIIGAFNIFPGPMMKMKFNSILNNAINEFKHYAETGRPADTKLKAMQKSEKKLPDSLFKSGICKFLWKSMVIKWHRVVHI